MRGDSTVGFYDALAEHYHLIFEDWEKSIARQSAILNRLIGAEASGPMKILDCACGIGTQALGFAMRGHRVVGSDLSPQAVARARREAANRGLELEMEFHVSDMTSLKEIADRDFDVVASLDNALPHLEPEQVVAAVRAMSVKVKPGGLILASIRDYDRLIVERPKVQEPVFYTDEGARRIVHQVWDWTDHDRYNVHLYITLERGGEWRALHFASEYRCLLRAELSGALEREGFGAVRWLMPQETGYYVPTVLARRGRRG